MKLYGASGYYEVLEQLPNFKIRRIIFGILNIEF